MENIPIKWGKTKIHVIFFAPAPSNLPKITVGQNYVNIKRALPLVCECGDLHFAVAVWGKLLSKGDQTSEL